MALPDLTGKNIQETYQRVIHTDGNKIYNGTGSLLPIEFNENNVIISGTLTAQTYVVSESITNVSSGSTIFGNSSDDLHSFTGSLHVSGGINGNSIRGDTLIANETIKLLAGAQDTTIMDFVLNTFQFGNSSYNTSISGSNIRLKAAGDVICNIPGGDLILNKAATEYFRFNLDDGIADIDVADDLRLDPGGGNVYVDGNITASGNIIGTVDGWTF